MEQTIGRSGGEKGPLRCESLDRADEVASRVGFHDVRPGAGLDDVREKLVGKM